MTAPGLPETRRLGQGISFPPRVDVGGRLAWSAGEQNVRECMRVVLVTELRERVRLPEFGCGLSRYLFEPNTTTTRRQIQDQVARALAAWEPRIRVEAVTVREGDTPEEAVVVVDYRLVATDAAEQLGLTVALGG